jgi:hypothetical protein
LLTKAQTSIDMKSWGSLPAIPGNAQDAHFPQQEMPLMQRKRFVLWANAAIEVGWPLACDSTSEVQGA